ncbi:MAG: proline--tRNA ligase [Chloroflexota bacterium]
MSKLFGQTLREIPTEAEVASHQLLLRAGFIRQLGAGIFTYLPLAHIAMTHIEKIMRDEMDAIGGQELTMPVVHPADIWKETGRWYAVGAEMARFVDRADRDMVLAMTHEEVVADLVRREIQSYRQLPALIYHIQTKFRDDPRPRAGLIRVREFTMLDSYSLDRDWEGLDAVYQAHYAAYFRIFNRCGLSVRAVHSDTGMMGGKEAHEYMYLTSIGEDTLLFCSHCDYSANRQSALFAKPNPEAEVLKEIEKVPTPNTSSIEDLSELLHIPKTRTAKAIFYMAELAGKDEPLFVFALLRGDLTLNETKLVNAIGTSGRGQVTDLRPALDEEILAVSAVPGYASPLDLPKADMLIVADDLIPRSPNLVAGANQTGFHLLNTNYGRDYTADVIADISSAEDGAPCSLCGYPMHTRRGVEVGNIFKLGSKYTDALGCSYLDENGQSQSVIMGSYGVGVGRLLGCIAEECHDEKGLIWPISVAPFPLHLIVLPAKSDELMKTADDLYKTLCSEGLTPLYDDRSERAGVKFNDADLIGLPIRLTVSERALDKGGGEVKLRSQDEKRIIPIAELVGSIKTDIDKLNMELKQRFNL